MQRALVLAGHGSHLNPHSSAPVLRHAAELRRRGIFDCVLTASWKEEPSLARALDGCTATDVTIVPVFISTGYFTEQVIPREMRLDGRVTRRDGQVIRYTAPIGAHPALARVILQRAEEAGARGDEALVILGHGTPRNPASERNVFAQAEHVRAFARFPEVATVFIDQEPNMRDVLALVHCRDIVMVPLFIADGWHVGETIPGDMGIEAGELARDGRTLRYARAVGTHPAIADVIIELAEEARAW